jgi:uncharacterized damage-inducible protein DinB
MKITDTLYAELEQEAVATKRLLERVPEEHLGWRPHAKSMTLGQLAMHVATSPGGIAQMAAADEVPMPEKFEAASAGSVAELLAAFEESVATAKQVLEGIDDARAMATWSATSGGKTIMSMPRIAVLRGFMLNHLDHHRGQLTVYLRMKDVPLPSIYGPTADEQLFA